VPSSYDHYLIDNAHGIILGVEAADSGARWARFRNHPGQHSEMNSGTIPG
jgi:hypothetical protein